MKKLSITKLFKSSEELYDFLDRREFVTKDEIKKLQPVHFFDLFTYWEILNINAQKN